MNDIQKKAGGQSMRTKKKIQQDRKEYMKEYRKTPKYKEYFKEYRKTPKYKEYMRKYMKEYRKTPKHKKAQNVKGGRS